MSQPAELAEFGALIDAAIELSADRPVAHTALMTLLLITLEASQNARRATHEQIAQAYLSGYKAALADEARKEMES
jgi:hypothetical protein